ncbi:dTMP kinase [Rubripirellula reticaptiva]|uniref:Thymidylate kinase n=1 Tax=Rubripirellula reticaptiva TaxID=2528013 RepID=A0A5C6EGV7_9BACT|nr:dTMP kinase [Rubripirellula reticaptiva]TWU48232.1 Thymidylate kinase [Rubripirellula reticaptiva]
MTTGMFVSLDGIDGVGKSTQINRLAEHFRNQGREVLCVRDPGTTAVGARLREILLSSDLTMHRRTEAIIFMASRSELVETLIRPALAEGKVVISDRFLLSTVVYQSIGGDVSPDLLWQLGRMASGNLSPDVTVLLDMPALDSMARIDRPADRMEARGPEYMESVRKAFLKQLPEASETTAVVDANQDIETVAKRIRELFPA